MPKEAQLNWTCYEFVASSNDKTWHFIGKCSIKPTRDEVVEIGIGLIKHFDLAFDPHNCYIGFTPVYELIYLASDE